MTGTRPMLHAREFAAMLSCLRPDGDRRALDLDLDAAAWRGFVALAEYHAVVPLVCARLRDAGAKMPADIEAELRASWSRTTRQALRLTASLCLLLDRFDEAGVRVMPFKGPVLAEQLYGGRSLRQFEDIDLLVPKEEAERAMRVLSESGYALDSSLDRLPMDARLRLVTGLPYKSADRTQVDLHWALTSDDDPARLDSEPLWERATRTTVAGRPMQTLAPEHAFVFLCVHGAGHGWSRLRWLHDVARFIEVTRDLDWDVVCAVASRTGAERSVLLALRLAESLLAAELPPSVRERAREVDAVNRLASEVEARLARSGTWRPTSLELALFKMRLAGGYGAGVRHLVALMKAPTEADVEVVRLPAALLHLYYAVRVARLSAKYARVLLRGVACARHPHARHPESLVLR